ncbi:MAG: hypothetical protein SGJ02_06610 [bacterium]|nr:hypothetical protein [bacterium]
MKLILLRYLTFLFFVLVTTSCDSIQKAGENSDIELAKKLSELLGKNKHIFEDFDLKQNNKAIESIAKNEVDKVFNVEYNVLEIDDLGDTAHINSALNKAGLDRWECFGFEHVGNKYRFFCKRKPQSVLRFLARNF